MKPLLRARLVWDLTPHHEVPEVLKLLGMTAPGPDVATLSCADSHRRLKRVEPLKADFAKMSHMSAEIMIRTMLGGAVDELDSELVALLVKQHGEVIRVGSLVSAAQLLDAGILTYSRTTK
ncbi:MULTISPECIES: hypothetical protein [Streptosporangium]|uniref:Uncharacterized protein n=1 Tax=Streptosporangium brasiliense TaxID=47480 RepID=A0ABT9RMC5_9ACTN|nr:hypothetical protein [Streptosporangium brasiliense]MDP9870438.1 hypothetical protein [Streptosporangium brasiliense]